MIHVRVVSGKYIFRTDLSDDALKKFKDEVKSINFSTLIDSKHTVDPHKDIESILTPVKIKYNHFPIKRIKIKNKV